MLKLINKIFKTDVIVELPWEYYFLQNLEESEYPRYLEKLFKYKTGEELPLLKEWSFKSCRMGICPRGQKFWNYIIDKNKCKTFNQKIQWIKLYGITPLMRDCTDKVKVRDYVRERIKAEYLKPVLQIIPKCHCDKSVSIQDLRSNPADLNNKTGWTASDFCPRSDRTDCHADTKMTLSARNDNNDDAIAPRSDNKDVTTYFDQIDFQKLPDSFVIKCNHGCKWHFIIKNKKEYLNTPKLIEITKRQITGWLEQDYSLWGGFELNYRNIKPKILIEPLMRDDVNKLPVRINVFCFNSVPEIIIKFHDDNFISVWDKNFNLLKNTFCFTEENINSEIDYNIKQSIDFSIELSKDFNFVRVDWMIYQNKLYFEELTFTPYSGFMKFKDRNKALEFGKLIKLK